jgi:hypothetical protein
MYSNISPNNVKGAKLKSQKKKFPCVITMSQLPKTCTHKLQITIHLKPQQQQVQNSIFNI